MDSDVPLSPSSIIWYQIILLGDRGTWELTTCTRQQGSWDLNPWPIDRKSGTLPLRHKATLKVQIKTVNELNQAYTANTKLTCPLSWAADSAFCLSISRSCSLRNNSCLTSSNSCVPCNKRPINKHYLNPMDYVHLILDKTICYRWIYLFTEYGSYEIT